MFHTATENKLLHLKPIQLFPHFEFPLLQNTPLIQAGQTFILQKVRFVQNIQVRTFYSLSNYLPADRKPDPATLISSVAF